MSGDKPEWSFESWIVVHNPAHRWLWFPNMTRDQVVVFRSSDSLFGMPVPHVAFDYPVAPSDAVPRASIEMRAVAYWYRRSTLPSGTRLAIIITNGMIGEGLWARFRSIRTILG